MGELLAFTCIELGEQGLLGRGNAGLEPFQQGLTPLRGNDFPGPSIRGGGNSLNEVGGHEIVNEVGQHRTVDTEVCPQCLLVGWVVVNHGGKHLVAAHRTGHFRHGLGKMRLVSAQDHSQVPSEIAGDESRQRLFECEGRVLCGSHDINHTRHCEVAQMICEEYSL